MFMLRLPLLALAAALVAPTLLPSSADAVAAQPKEVMHADAL